MRLGFSEIMALQVMGLRPLASSFGSIPGRLPLDVFVKAVSQARAESGDPLFCIRAGLEQSVADFSLLSQLAFFSRDLNQVLELYCRYLTSVNPGFPTRIERKGAICELPVENSLFSVDEASALMELRMASCVRILRIITFNRSNDPIASVHFSHQPGVSPEEYQQLLNTNVCFSQPYCSFSLHSESLDIPIPTHNQHMLSETIIKAQEKQKSQLHQYDDFIDRVKTQIRSTLVSGRVDLDYIAGCMVMSISSLKRQLKKRDTSFQRLLDDVRREEIIDLLINTQLPVSEIATKVGLSSASALAQTCRRLLNCSPLEYRRIS